MRRPRRARGAARPTAAHLALACAVATLWLAPQGAAAQGKLEAQYEASLAGIPVGKGSWAIEIGEDSYSAAAQGATAGLLKAFSGGTGTGSVQGRVVNGALVPGQYNASIASKKSETIRINIVGGNAEVTFTGPATALPADFKLQSSISVASGYTDDNSANLTQLTAGPFQSSFKATTALSGDKRFYKIKR